MAFNNTIWNLPFLFFLQPGHYLWNRSEEVGQAGRKASWVPVPNCARDFIESKAVVE